MPEFRQQQEHILDSKPSYYGHKLAEGLLEALSILHGRDVAFHAVAPGTGSAPKRLRITVKREERGGRNVIAVDITHGAIEGPRDEHDEKRTYEYIPAYLEEVAANAGLSVRRRRCPIINQQCLIDRSINGNGERVDSFVFGEDYIGEVEQKLADRVAFYKARSDKEGEQYRCYSFQR